MDSAVQIIVGKLGQLVADEIRKARAVSGEVVHLKNELATMNAALLMLSEADNSAIDHLLREWGRQVRDLAFDIEDCIDIFKYRTTYFPRMVFVVSYVYQKFRKSRLRSNLFEDVQALRARAVVVGECHARYVVTRQALGARSVVYSDPVQRVAPQRPAGVSLRLRRSGDQFICNKEVIYTLAKRVNEADECSMRLRIFTIVGCVGLGKTTLAMNVCRQLEGEFDCQALVSLPQAFDAGKDLKGLLKRLLYQILKVEGCKEEDEEIHKTDIEGLASELRGSLEAKRYLIVIDDVRTIEVWDAIQTMFPVNNFGSRIIVTTRMGTLAEAIAYGNDGLYLMERLKIVDSWMLFWSTAWGCFDGPFGSNDFMARVIGLHGLPLVIVSIAGLLGCYDNIYDMGDAIWDSIDFHKLCKDPTPEGMKEILVFCYNHLPNHLKGCAMYLSIFQGNFFIKYRLLYRWIAEGLVEEKQGFTLMEVAEHYFDQLISRSIILRTADKIETYVWEETYWVHGLMLEVLVSKSLEVNFVSLVGGQYEGRSYDKIRRLSIHGDVHASKPGTGKRLEGMVNMQHVRSLTTFQSEGHKLLDRLGEFTLLSVLDLEDNKGLQNKHLKYICRLYLLRFLSLKGTDITVMPQQVCELSIYRHLMYVQHGLTDYQQV